MSKPDKVLDGLLVLHCQGGDKKAFSILVKRWHIKLCKQAYWTLKDKEIAKDIVQDSWTVILKKIPTLKEPNNFGAWASTIVHRKSIDWLRNRKKEEDKLSTYYKETTKDDPSFDANSLNEATHDTLLSLRGAIVKLPANQQLILRLFYLEEYSIIDIGKTLELSVGTVKSRLFYAREKLKKVLINK